MATFTKIFAAALIVFFLSSATAGAYAIGSPNPSTAGGLNDLWTPFQNFVNNINSISTNSFTMSTPAVPSSGTLTTEAQNGFQEFDAWLYGIMGFHISGLFVAILTIFSWILGWLQSGVNWLLGLIK